MSSDQEPDIDDLDAYWADVRGQKPRPPKKLKRPRTPRTKGVMGLYNKACIKEMTHEYCQQGREIARLAAEIQRLRLENAAFKGVNQALADQLMKSMLAARGLAR